MSRDYFSNARRSMRREFARLIEEDPEAFAACVEEYNRKGGDHFPPEEQTGGAPKATPDISLALLLADYRHAQARGITQRQFFADNAGRGIRTGDKTRGRVWDEEEAIEAALNKARRKEKADADFAEQVEFYQFAIAAIGGVNAE